MLSLGALLLMTAQRPEFRTSQGETAAGRALVSVGSGSSAVGSAILGYHALVYARRQGRGAAASEFSSSQESAAETRSADPPM